MTVFRAPYLVLRSIVPPKSSRPAAYAADRGSALLACRGRAGRLNLEREVVLFRRGLGGGQGGLGVRFRRPPDGLDLVILCAIVVLLHDQGQTTVPTLDLRSIEVGLGGMAERGRPLVGLRAVGVGLRADGRDLSTVVLWVR